MNSEQINSRVITKKEAVKFLEKNDKNRKLSRHVVSNYASMINRGEWQLSIDPIAFDTNGRLINGQHRLSALIKSEAEELPFYVALNQDPSLFSVLDAGKKRGGGDVLSIQGFKNPTILASAAKFLTLYDQGVEDEDINKTRNISNSQVASALDINPDLSYSVDFVMSVRRKHKFMVEPSFVGFLHYVYSQVDAAKADTFVLKLGDGMGLQEQDAIAHLRKILINDLQSRKKMTLLEKRALIVKAFNYHMQDLKTKRFRWRVYNNENGELTRADKFPSILNFEQKDDNSDD